MRKLIAPIAALALFGSLTAALAETKTGKIVKLDVARDTIDVENIQVKIEGVKVEGLKEGDNVKIEYMVGDDGNHLQSIVKM